MAYKNAGDVVRAIREGTYKRPPKKSSSSGGNTSIYIPIDDITSTKEDGVQKIDIKEGANVYQRSQGGFKRTGRTSSSGVRQVQSSGPQSTIETPTPAASTPQANQTQANRQLVARLRAAQRRKTPYVADQPKSTQRNITPAARRNMTEEQVRRESFNPSKKTKSPESQKEEVKEGPKYEVQPAPTFSDTWKDYTSQRGYLTGTLDLFGDTISSLAWKGQGVAVKNFGGKYDVQAAEFQGGAARIAPYFIPGGGYLLLGEGVEGLTSKKGKQDISMRYTSLIDKGTNKYLAGGLAVTPEVLQIGLGFVTSPLGKKTKDLIKVRGKKIPISDLTQKEVIAGTKSFPTAPPQTHLPKFKAQGKGYHSTSQIWDDLVTTKGSSELPGTYISTDVSPHFLRVPGEKPKFDIIEYIYADVIHGTTHPGIMEITPSGFRKGKYTPAPTGSQNPYTWTDDAVKGVVEVPGMKTEIEGIIRPDSILKFEGSAGYTLWGGRRIPIDKFSIVGTGTAAGTGTLGGYSSSYGGAGIGFSYSNLIGVGGIITNTIPTSSSKPSSPQPTSSYSPPVSSPTPSSYSPSPPSYSKPKSSGGSSRSSPIKTPISYTTPIPSGSSSKPPTTPPSYFRGSYSKPKPTFYPPRIKPPTRKPPALLRFNPKPTRKNIPKPFGVQVRRFGRFYSLGSYRTQKQAVSVGKTRVSGGLGATFRLTGKGSIPLNLKGFRTKKTDEGLLFIEKRKYRLSKKSETRAIQAAKRRKKSLRFF